MDKVRSWMTSCLVVATLAFAGVAAGSVVAPPAVAQGCERDACNKETGNCISSDVDYNCNETAIDPSAGGCASTRC